MGVKLTVQTVLIIVLLFAASFWLEYRREQKYTEWNMDTKTLADYTVRMEIPARAYDHFVKNIDPTMAKNPKESINYRFK